MCLRLLNSLKFKKRYRAFFYMKDKRQNRISQAYQKELTSILLYEVRDPRLDGLCVTDVVITPDLRLAKVYYDIPGGRERVVAVEKGFQKAKGYIKKELARRVNIKYMPDLVFYFDETAALQERVDQLFAEVKRSPDQQ
ncbi:MAG: hypothetical protein ACD_62C00170G0010 [uncultured bacterium]|nr:MAG: hypothetical protein ACD_62C00170G0010 [uncultured bacterium]